ncbi:hypothetical protein Droror1_Dr00008440 [Drosera rotundifolia]
MKKAKEAKGKTPNRVPTVKASAAISVAVKALEAKVKRPTKKAATRPSRQTRRKFVLKTSEEAKEATSKAPGQEMIESVIEKEVTQLLRDLNTEEIDTEDKR